jgi:hypothetical protein
MKRFAKAGTLIVLVLAISAVVVIPAVAADEAPAAAPCDEGRWPATVQGKPGSFVQGGRAGYYVWHDARGWHLRTTTPQRSPHPFTGTIVSSGDIKVVHQYKDEGRDSVTVNGNRLTFSFVTYNGVDGIDFKVGCTRSLSFSLKAYNRLVPSTRIWLGRDGTARSNPFTVKRVS